MRRSDQEWVSCPVCDAGSPAGISICPRCRYRFRIVAGREMSDFEPSSPLGDSDTGRRASGQFTLGTILFVVAALAVCFALPILIFPICVILLALILNRARFSLLATCVIIAIIGVVIGLTMPAIVMHRHSGSESVNPVKLALQRTLPVAVVGWLVAAWLNPRRTAQARSGLSPVPEIRPGSENSVLMSGQKKDLI